MGRRLAILLLLVLLTPYFAFADAIEELERRGIDRGAIEKARMTIYENTQYKGLNAAIYYCDLLPTKINIDGQISATKRIKGRSGNPSYTRLEGLDESYAINTMEIKEQKKLYKSAFGKSLNPKICKKKEDLSLQLDNLHDRLLLKAFAAQVAK